VTIDLSMQADYMTDDAEPRIVDRFLVGVPTLVVRVRDVLRVCGRRGVEVIDSLHSDDR
jgi:hypothetical protein